jgi:hypothetical protein
MRILACYIMLGMVMTFPELVQRTRAGDPVVLLPRQGDVLQGVVIIYGSTYLNGFVSAEIAFSYADDPTGTWFLISMMNQPVFNDRLVLWDTTVITDGDYVLRLRVYMTDGNYRDTFALGLRVRNYTIVEAVPPNVLAADATPLLTNLPMASPFPTPTSLPHNPAALTPTDVALSIVHGGMAAILILVTIGAYLWFRRNQT